MATNWNLLQVPDIAQTFQQSYSQGQQTRAIGDLVRDPNNQGAMNALLEVNPGVGMQFQDRQRAVEKSQREEQERQLIGAALSGDPTARQRLAYVNSDMYMKLGEQQRKAVDATMNAIGQQAFSILQLPPEQRGPALQQALQTLQAQGVDISGFKPSGDPTNDLKAALAMTGQLDKWEQFSQPKYVPVGEGGLSGFQFGKPIMQGGQTQDFGAPQPQPMASDPATILQNAAGTKLITPEEADTVRRSLGPNGQGAFQQWMQQNGIAIGKSVNGQTFYQINGKWYDNPEGR